VLIVNANRVVRPMPVMPVGACVVADAAARAGHDVELLDLAFARRPRQALVRALDTLAPKVTGISFRNIDNGDMLHPESYVVELRDLVQTAKEHSDASVGLGGPGVSIMPQGLLDYTGADWAVAGEGEAAFPELLASLDRPDGVPGVVTRGSGGVPVPARTLFTSTAADFTRWLDVRSYVRRMATAPLQTKRGCPFNCVYCTYPLIEGKACRLGSPPDVVAAVESLLSQGLRDVEFVDSLFNEPLEHALAVCDALAQAETGARLHCLDVSPAGLDDELLGAMRRAGFVALGVTVESAANPVLAGLGKSFSEADVHAAAHAVGRHDIPCLWVFLLGGPGETEETVEQTIRFAAERVRPTDAAFFMAGVRIYPGTQLERIAREQGLLTKPKEEMIEPVFYVSPQVDAAWLATRLRRAAEEHLHFICGESAALPFLPALSRVAYAVGLRPPVWRHGRRVLRMLRTVGRMRQSTTGNTNAEGRSASR